MKLLDYLKKLLSNKNKRKTFITDINLREISIMEASRFSEIQTIHNLISNAAARATVEVHINNVKNNILSENADHNIAQLLADYIVYSVCLTDPFLNYYNVIDFIDNIDSVLENKKYILIENNRKILQNSQTLLNKLYHLNRLEVNHLIISKATILLKYNNANYAPTTTELDELKRALNDKMHAADASFFITSSDFTFEFPRLLETINNVISYRQQIVRELCALYAIDAQFFNDASHKTYNNKFEALRSLYTNLIIPALYELFYKVKEKEMFRSFDFIINIDEIELLSDYKKEQAHYILSLYDKGIITKEEARKFLSLE